MGQATDELTNALPASPEVWPAAAFVDVTLADGTHFPCSGVLIAPDNVLTSATCTRCATSGSVRVRGGSTTAGAPSATVYPIVEISWNPLAFDGPVTCESSSWSNANDAIAHDANVAVVKLAFPVPGSQAAPMAVLTEPPWKGFSPVQDLYGVNLDLVGRGADDVPGSRGGTHVGVMRAGLATLTKYGPSFISMFCGNPGSASEPFRLWWTDAAQSIPQYGDSGGITVGQPWGSKQVLGVINSAIFLGFATPTWTVKNAGYIRERLTCQWSAPPGYPLEPRAHARRTGHEGHAAGGRQPRGGGAGQPLPSRRRAHLHAGVERSAFTTSGSTSPSPVLAASAPKTPTTYEDLRAAPGEPGGCVRRAIVNADYAAS